jgi:hypothetical protein
LYTYIALICYQLCLCMTKLSVLAFYLRMFSSRPVERRLAKATIVWVVVYGIPMVVLSVLQCHPSAGRFFDIPMSCVPFQPLLIASASLHTVTDAWLIAMVVPCITGLLDLPPRQRAALAAVLSLSIFVIAASLTRLQLSLRANYRPSAPGVRVADTLAFFVMTVLECDIALMCASAPTLRGVVARLWPRLGMGDQKSPMMHLHPANRAERRNNRRSLWRMRNGGGSYDLTAVSFNGYPWAAAAEAAPQKKVDRGSKAISTVTEDTEKLAVGPPPMPLPPMPLPPLGTATAAAPAQQNSASRSLRSLVGNMAGRRNSVRAAALRNSHGEWDNDTEDNFRVSAVGLDVYYEQYLGYALDERRRGVRNSVGRVSQIGGSSGPWGDSQESFVLGLNDPASPSRLSPVSDLSGDTFTADERMMNDDTSLYSLRQPPRARVHENRLDVDSDED